MFFFFWVLLPTIALGNLKSSLHLHFEANSKFWYRTLTFSIRKSRFKVLNLNSKYPEKNLHIWTKYFNLRHIGREREMVCRDFFFSMVQTVRDFLLATISHQIKYVPTYQNRTKIYATINIMNCLKLSH